MDALIAIGITVLFACWVCRLKQEVGDLERRLLAGSSRDGQDETPSHQVLKEARAPSAPAPRRGLRAKRVTREHGIPTWTIA